MSGRVCQQVPDGTPALQPQSTSCSTHCGENSSLSQCPQCRCLLDSEGISEHSLDCRLSCSDRCVQPQMSTSHRSNDNREISSHLHPATGSMRVMQSNAPHDHHKRLQSHQKLSRTNLLPTCARFIFSCTILLSLCIGSFAQKTLPWDSWTIEDVATGETATSDPIVDIPDLVAAVGHLFQYRIPADIFDARSIRYQVRQSGQKTLPKWLHFNQTSATFVGVPLAHDEGKLYIALDVYATKGGGSIVVAESLFSIRVVVSGETKQPVLATQHSFPLSNNSKVLSDGYSTSNCQPNYYLHPQDVPAYPYCPDNVPPLVARMVTFLDLKSLGGSERARLFLTISEAVGICPHMLVVDSVDWSNSEGMKLWKQLAESDSVEYLNSATILSFQLSCGILDDRNEVTASILSRLDEYLASQSERIMTSDRRDTPVGFLCLRWFVSMGPQVLLTSAPVSEVVHNRVRRQAIDNEPIVNVVFTTTIPELVSSPTASSFLSDTQMTSSSSVTTVPAAPQTISPSSVPSASLSDTIGSRSRVTSLDSSPSIQATAVNPTSSQAIAVNPTPSTASTADSTTSIASTADSTSSTASTADSTSSTASTADSTSSTASTADSTSSTASTADSTSSTASTADSTSSIASTADSTSSTSSAASIASSSSQQADVSTSADAGVSVERSIKSTPTLSATTDPESSLQTIPPSRVVPSSEPTLIVLPTSLPITAALPVTTTTSQSMPLSTTSIEELQITSVPVMSVMFSVQSLLTSLPVLTESVLPSFSPAPSRSFSIQSSIEDLPSSIVSPSIFSPSVSFIPTTSLRTPVLTSLATTPESTSGFLMPETSIFVSPSASLQPTTSLRTPVLTSLATTPESTSGFLMPETSIFVSPSASLQPTTSLRTPVLTSLAPTPESTSGFLMPETSIFVSPSASLQPTTSLTTPVVLTSSQIVPDSSSVVLPSETTTSISIEPTPTPSLSSETLQLSTSVILFPETTVISSPVVRTSSNNMLMPMSSAELTLSISIYTPFPTPSTFTTALLTSSMDLFPMPTPSISTTDLSTTSIDIFPMSTPSIFTTVILTSSMDLFPMSTPSISSTDLSTTSIDIFPMSTPSIFTTVILTSSMDFFPMPTVTSTFTDTLLTTTIPLSSSFTDILSTSSSILILSPSFTSSFSFSSELQQSSLSPTPTSSEIFFPETSTVLPESTSFVLSRSFTMSSSVAVLDSSMLIPMPSSEMIASQSIFTPSPSILFPETSAIPSESFIFPIETSIILSETTAFPTTTIVIDSPIASSTPLLETSSAVEVLPTSTPVIVTTVLPTATPTSSQFDESTTIIDPFTMSTQVVQPTTTFVLSTSLALSPSPSPSPDPETFCEANGIVCESGTCLDDDDIDLMNDIVCECYPDVTGKFCNEIIDNCDPFPCHLNGTSDCIDGNATFTCICNVGYTGPLCDEEIDSCLSTPCQDSATCLNLGMGEFECVCPPGYSGTLCENDIDLCDPFPCHVNGTSDCINGNATFTCLCNVGYTGALCDEEIDSCLSTPCRHLGATCLNLGMEEFECLCPPGFSGTLCENDIDPCDPDPCQVDEICIILDSQKFSCNETISTITTSLSVPTPSHSLSSFIVLTTEFPTTDTFSSEFTTSFIIETPSLSRTVTTTVISTFTTASASVETTIRATPSSTPAPSTSLPTTTVIPTPSSTTVSSSLRSFTTETSQMPSLSPTPISTPVVNLNPMLLNPIGTLIVNMGQLFRFSIPENTFYDPESGMTSSLSLTLLNFRGEPLPNTTWIQVQQRSLEGLPLASEVVNEAITYHVFILQAQDEMGSSAHDFITIRVLPLGPFSTFFTVLFENAYETFSQNLTQKLSLVQRLSSSTVSSPSRKRQLELPVDAYNTDEIFVNEFLDESALAVSYKNVTIPDLNCAEFYQWIANIYNYSMDEYTEGFVEAMAPEFTPTPTPRIEGTCNLVSSNVPPIISEIDIDVEDDFQSDKVLLLSTIIPTSAVALCCLLAGLCALFMYRRYRTERRYMTSKRLYLNRRPIILEGEVDLPSRSRRPVVLANEAAFGGPNDNVLLQEEEEYSDASSGDFLPPAGERDRLVPNPHLPGYRSPPPYARRHTQDILHNR